MRVFRVICRSLISSLSSRSRAVSSPMVMVGWVLRMSRITADPRNCVCGGQEVALVVPSGTLAPIGALTGCGSADREVVRRACSRSVPWVAACPVHARCEAAGTGSGAPVTAPVPGPASDQIPGIGTQLGGTVGYSGLDAYRFRRQYYYAVSCVTLSTPDSNSAGVR